MRRLVPVLLVALPLVTQADEGLEDGPKIIVPTVVRAQLDGMTAVMTARFWITANSGETEYTFTKPGDSVITGAIVTSEGTAHRLVLQRAEAAADHFEEARSGTWAEVTAKTKNPIRRSGALVTVSGDDATLRLLAHRGGPIAVEIEMTVPTCFVDDARYITVRDSWLRAIDPAAKHAAPKDIETWCAFPGEHMTWIGFPAKDLATRPSGDARVGATAGRLAIGQDHTARVELDLAGTLSDIPPDLATVILIDGSRSMSFGELETQRQIVESYVRNAKATRVQVIAYARTPRAILPTWSMATVALPRLDRELRALVPRNGSNIDAGMLEAGAWLARVAGTRRVVLLTDERIPNRLEDVDGVAWRKLLPPATLVHVVTVDDGADALVRNADAIFLPLATATSGLAVRGGASDDQPAAAELLVHPISLDEIVVRSEGWKESPIQNCALTEGESLRQGASCTFWFDGSALSGPIVIEGKIWGQPVTRTLRPDPTKGVAIARELVGMEAFPVDAEDRALIEDAAHAVSSGWSLFGAWGGTAGYGELYGMGRSGFGPGGCCEGDIGSSGTSGFGHMNPAHLDVKWQLRNALRTCHAERERVEVTLELTLEEIAGVAVTAKTPDIATCVEEAIWETTLAIDHPLAHQTTEFGLGPL